MNNPIEVVILGTAQDGSIPHPNCHCDTCLEARNDLSKRRLAACLGVIDHETKQWFLIEATPDFSEQLHRMQSYLQTKDLMSGIMITHGHIGHYTGLMFLGKECMSAKQIPVFIEKSLSDALKTSIPFSFLYTQENIIEHELKHQCWMQLTPNLRILPILVPHRNEVGKTFGFIIEGTNQSLLFIPDLDHYEGMDPTIESLIERVDIALIDATFYVKEEIDGVRDYRKIPHPTIEESMKRLSHLANERDIRFIHLNHSNLVLKDESLFKKVKQVGFSITNDMDTIKL